MQEVFNRQKVQKKIPIDRLIHARFQDNLEFLQWFYQFLYKVIVKPEEYNPIERRERSKGANKWSFAKTATKSKRNIGKSKRPSQNKERKKRKTS
eukprot:UN25998